MQHVLEVLAWVAGFIIVTDVLFVVQLVRRARKAGR